MKPGIDRQDGERFLASDWLTGVRVAENVVALTHVLGRRRLVCCNFVAEILLHDFQSPSTVEEVAQRRNARVALIRSVVDVLYAALLMKKAGTDESAAIRQSFDARFADRYMPDSARQRARSYPQWLSQRSSGVRGGAGSVTNADRTNTDLAIDLDTHLQLSSAAIAMSFGEDAGGVITHFLEGPLLVERDLWNLATAFREGSTVAEALSSSDLRHYDAEQITQSCQFLVRRRILCTSRNDEIETIRERIAPEIDLVNRRFEVHKDLTPAGYEDPHFVWYQTYGYHSINAIRSPGARGRVAFLGQCQSHFVAGPLEYLAEKAGWHLETHGWFAVPDELEGREWSLVVLPTVLEAAAFYEALAVGDLAGCRKTAPEVVSEVNRNVCLIREKTDAPVLIVSVGEPTLSGHGVATGTRHGMKRIIAELNDDLMDSIAAFDNVHLLDETSVLSKYPGTVTLDDEYNATPHHCGFDLWSWRDHPFEASHAVIPEKSVGQIHPAFPLAFACLEHLQHLYLSPRVKLIVFEPNGVLWPGVVDHGSKPYPRGINVYTGLDDFVHIGIHEALCAVHKRGIKLACLSSSGSELLRQSLLYDSDARNLVREEDLICISGGDDKPALLARIIAMANVSEEEVLWIDLRHRSESDFAGHCYDGAIYELRRYLLTEPLLSPQRASTNERPRPAVSGMGDTAGIPDRDAISATVNRVLSGHLNCTDSALQSTDDLRLLGLDSFGCVAVVLELEEALRFRLPDHDHVGSVLFSRQGLLAAITRALESTSTNLERASDGPDSWFDGFSRKAWCDKDVGSILSHHVEKSGVGWILKFVRSGTPFDYQYVTWAELYGKALGYTRLFRGTGLNPGDTITILLPQGLSLVAAVTGAILGGMVPSVSAFPGEKLTSEAFLKWFGELVVKSRTRCVVCTDELRFVVERELEASGLTVAMVTAVPEAVVDEPIYAASPDSPVILQHSSGTTGIKKGVRLSHRALLAQTWDLSRALACNSRDVIVSWLPYYHDMGLVACLMLPLLRSVPTVVMSPFDWVRQPHMLMRQVSEEKGTLCWLPNFAFFHCANRIRADQLDGMDLACLRAVINCSEPVTYDAMTAFYERFKRFGMRYSALSSSYAMAESTFAVTQTQTGRPARTVKVSSLTLARDGKIRRVTGNDGGDVSRLVSSGRVLPGVRVRIVDEGGILGEGETGEIQVQGDYLFPGYFNDDESTRDAFDDEWFRTGDLGLLLDGELYVTGRSKDLIIVSGHNVYPHDIENTISAIPGIKPGRAVAFGIYDDEGGTEKLIVMAEMDTESLPAKVIMNEETLKAVIRENVLSRFFVNVSDILLFGAQMLRKSTSGKLARNANRELYLELKNSAG